MLSTNYTRPVLHIITGLGIGGAETMLAQLAPALARRGLPQIVVSLTGDGPRSEPLLAAGVPIVCLNLRRPAALMSAVWHLPTLVQRHRPRAIQGWLYHGDLAATYAHRMSPGRRDRLLLWSVRCSDMDLARHGRVIGLCARVSHIPDIVTVNSQTGASHHAAVGYRPRRLEIVDNGFDTDRFRPDPARRRQVRAALGLASEQVVAINVARVDPMKDHAGLLTAVKGLDGLTVILVGRGTETLDCPPNVMALGARTDVPDLLAAADIVVSSSAFGEGFCNAVAEGMSAGLAPVVTDVGDARRIVGETGCIVPPSDPAALRDALSAMVGQAAGQPASFAARQSAARDRIMGLFTLDRAVERFAALYDTRLPLF